MNPKDKNFKYQKSLYGNSDTKISKPQNKKEKLKFKIMSKYNITESEAERILVEIGKREKINNSKSKISKNPQVKKEINNPDQSSIDSIKIQTKTTNNISKKVSKVLKSNQVAHIQNHVKSKNRNENQNSDVENHLINQKLKINSDNQNGVNEKSLNNKKPQKSENVDALLSDIIPDYNKQISISVNHVDLTFEVQNEKIDTLKETFIRTLRGDAVNKIKIHALKDVSFEIYKGEKVGIIGYNGAGKSTLLGVITGIYPPDKGTVKTVGNISPLLSLGAGFDYNFSGRKNIILNGAVLGYDRQFLESKVDEIIEFSELGEFIDIPIKNYSSGMIAKLGFSIATAVEPDILIIDEILGVGDVNFKKKSNDKMRSLMDGGTTVLLVSHSIPQIRELCDKAIWIDDGKLREIGEVNKVCDHYLKDAEKASNEQLANIQFR